MGRVPGTGRGVKFADPPPPGGGQNPVPPARATRQTTLDPREITLNESAAGLLREPIFGPYVQGLKLLYGESYDNGATVYLVAAIGEGPIQSSTILGDDVAFTNDTGNHWVNASGKIEAWFYDGSQNNVQETSSGLFARDPTWITTGSDPNKGYNFLAFWVIKWTWDANLNTDLPKFKFTGNGYSDLYDARDGLRRYSENFSLFAREIMTNTRWGFKIPNNSTFFNDTEWSTAATDCDTQVFPVAPTSAPSLSPQPSGVLNGGYTWVYTFVNSNGVETTPSPVATSGFLVNQKEDITFAVGDSLTAKRRIYRAGGSLSQGVYHLVVEIPDNTTTLYTDNNSDASIASNAGPPTVMPNTKRYNGGIHCATQASGLEWLTTIRSACLGVITPENGRYEMRINKKLAGGYTRKQYSEFHNWGGGGENPNINPGSIQWGRSPRSDVFNEIEIKYLDRNSNLEPSSVIKQRAAVVSGAEMPRRAVYDLQSMSLDSGTAGRLATQLLNLAWDDANFEWEADRSALATQVWDVVALTGGGLFGQDVRVRKIRSKGERFILSGTEYHDSSYSDAINTVDAPLAVMNGLFASGATPPEITNPVASVGQNTAQLYFGQSLQRSTTRYTSASWSPNNLHSYDGTKVNDGNISVACFDWNVSGASQLVVDVGSSKLIREFEIYTSAFAADPAFDFSDNGSSWTFGGARLRTTQGMGGGITRRVYEMLETNPHRYWRLNKGEGSTLAEATTFTEVWPREYTTAPGLVREYRVYNLLDLATPKKLYTRVEPDALPTLSVPLELNPIARHDVNSSNIFVSLFSKLDVLVTAVGTNGIESPGVEVVAQSFISPMGSAPSLDVTFVNGANNNVPLPTNGSGYMRIVGPTVDTFSLTGIVAPPLGGFQLVVENGTGFEMNVFNESASSTAANRILTPDALGAQPVNAGQVFVLVYDATAQRWQMTLNSSVNQIKVTKYNGIGAALDIRSESNVVTSVLFLTQHASDATTLGLFSGNGTNSGRVAYFSVGSSETSPQGWLFGMNGTKDYKIRDTTAGADRFIIDTSGKVGINGTPAFRLHVIDTTAPQIVAEYDGTHRSMLSHDGTNGYVGTKTNNPFRVRTNDTDRVWLDTSGNVGIGQSPSVRLHVGAGGTGATAEEVRVDSGSASGGHAMFRFYRNGVEKGTIAVDGTGGIFTITSVPNDFVIRSSQAILFTANAGTNTHLGIYSAGNVVAGKQAALATNATDGFLYIESCAGTPTGTPTGYTGEVPIIIDTTNGKFWAYYGGAWHFATLT